MLIAFLSQKSYEVSMAKDQKLIFKADIDTKPFEKKLKKMAGRSSRFKSAMGRIWGALKSIIVSPFTSLIAVTAGVATFFASIKAGAEDLIKLRSAFADIDSLIAGEGGLTESTKKYIVEQSKIYGTTAVENAKAYYDIVSGGIRDTRTAQELLNEANKVAVIGNESVKNTTEALLAVMKAYGEENVSAKEAADVLQTTVNRGIITWPKLAANLSTVTALAAKAGVEFKELGALIASISGMKVEAPEVMTYIRGLLTSLLNTKGSAAKAIQEELGIDWSVEAVKAKGFQQVFTDLVDKAGEFPEKVKALIPNIRGVMGALTGGDFKEIMEFFKDPGGAVDDAYRDKARTIERQILRARAAAADLWRSPEMAKGLLMWEKFKVVLGHIVPRIIDVAKWAGRVGQWSGLKYLLNLGKSKGLFPALQKDLDRISNPTDAQLVEEKKKTQSESQKKIEQEITKAEQKRANSLVEAHEKIKKLTETSVRAIARGVEQIREKTREAIQQIKNAFFGGGSLGGAASAQKIFSANPEARGAYSSLAKDIDIKSLSGSGMAQLAHIAKQVAELGNLSEFQAFLRNIKKLRGSQLKAEDVKGAFSLFQASQGSDQFALNQLKKFATQNIQSRELKGKELEKEYMEKANQKLAESALKILKGADKQMEASERMDSATKILKQAIEEQREILRNPIELRLKGDLYKYVEETTERKKRSNTVGAGLSPSYGGRGP